MMRMVTVNPKIWNVIVIGILSPPLRGETKPPIAVLEPQGFKRTITILPDQSKNVNPCGRFRALDKPQEPAIIKTAKAPSARTVWPRIKLVFQEISKPSLCRVAVSAIYADGDRQSKNMERDRNRHKHPSFRRRPNRPSASGALGFKKNQAYSTRPAGNCQSVLVLAA